jgi:aryl-alcohol dehydrogenase-like predicted oxidoreductase
MQYGQLPGIDKPISRLVQGSVMVSTADPDYSNALLDDVFGLGCTTFDMAHVYGNGDVERAFGQWLGDRGLRDQVVILTKGAHHSRDRKRVTPYDITADLHDSLARLKVDYIDLYILHRDDPDLPVGPIVEVLNEHHAAGKIGAFGGSNWTTARVQEANEYAAAHNLVPFVASSPNFSLAEQINPPWDGCISIGGPKGAAARAWYGDNQLALFTWSSLAGGFFSGRITRENRDTLDSNADKLCLYAYGSDENFERLDRARILGEEKGLTIPQIATTYVLSQPLNIFALVGCRTKEEFQQNLIASELKLSAEEMDWLDLKRDNR